MFPSENTTVTTVPTFSSEKSMRNYGVVRICSRIGREKLLGTSASPHIKQVVEVGTWVRQGLLQRESSVTTCCNHLFCSFLQSSH